MEEVTIDKIISWLEEQVREKHPIDPQTWLEAGLKLTLLMGDEHGRLFTLQQIIAQQKTELLKLDNSVAKVNLMLEATDQYREMRIQEAKIKRIEELVRLSKKYATLANEEYSHQ